MTAVDSIDSSKESARLNKYLALQLGISRREADNLINTGEVTINMAPATLGARFRPNDTISIKGKPLKSAVRYRYIMLNKPIGYVSSRKPQGDAPTIYQLLPTDYHALKPAGRLDKDSSGLLILTNDGDFAYRMTHPKFRKTKQYEIALDSELAPLHQQMISDYGVRLEDGDSKLHLERLTDDDRKQWHITMSEGRNRQIRRTFAALGYTVTRLHRTHFGSYSLGDMKPGSFADIDMR